MANNNVSTPASFGGIMSYGEEYDSKINLKPEYVVVFVLLIIGLRVVLPMIF